MLAKLQEESWLPHAL